MRIQRPCGKHYRHREDQEQRRQNATGATLVEADDGEAAALHVVADDRRNQKARDHEDVDADITARKARYAGMKQHDRQNRDGAQPVNVAAIGGQDRFPIVAGFATAQRRGRITDITATQARAGAVPLPYGEIGGTTTRSLAIGPSGSLLGPRGTTPSVRVGRFFQRPLMISLPSARDGARMTAVGRERSLSFVEPGPNTRERVVSDQGGARGNEGLSRLAGIDNVGGRIRKRRRV